jgi:uncharacterized protein (DUF2147 family)
MARTARFALTGLSIGIFCLFIVISATAGGAADLSPIGVWATEGATSHVKIDECGGKLCGAIVWLKQPLNKEGKDKVDSENPDPGLRMRKLLGLPLLNGFVQDEDQANVWTNGKIYNPDDGKTYSCKLTLQDAKTLRVRGYVGFSILGKTQIWNRVE